MYRRAVGMAILVSIAGASVAMAAPRTELWYRGSFDGKVAVQDTPVPGYYYSPSRPTAYPLFESRQSYPLPCDRCGHYHQAGAQCGQCRTWCAGNGTHIDKDRVYSPDPLPGQYYYKKQPHFNFRSPIRVGWPYMKYDTPY